MSPIRAVISDFGGVLTSPLMEAFTRFQDEAGIGAGDLGRAMGRIMAADGEHPLFELERGRMSEANFLDRMQAALLEETGRPVHMHGFTRTYWEALEPNQAMIDLMGGLRGRGYRTALLTNNVREWEPNWRSMLPVDEIFEVVVDSAFVGMRKPEPEIYSLTLERLGDGIRAPDCLFVDDVELNCQTAQELGMSTVHFRETEQAVAEIEEALGPGQEGERAQ